MRVENGILVTFFYWHTIVYNIVQCMYDMLVLGWVDSSYGGAPLLLLILVFIAISRSPR